MTLGSGLHIADSLRLSLKDLPNEAFKLLKMPLFFFLVNAHLSFTPMCEYYGLQLDKKTASFKETKTYFLFPPLSPCLGLL